MPPIGSGTAAMGYRNLSSALDNMVLEARDVSSSAVKKFKKDFDAFAKALPGLLDSISAQIPREAFRAGLEKIISWLKSLAQFLQSRALQEAIGYLLPLS
jgi:hypothetical protein